MNAAGLRAARVTLRDLLSANRYEVPVYQRNYSWAEEQIRQLIDDLLDVATAARRRDYFLGNIVVAPVSGSADAPYSLIDGQQRLTTLHILFKYLAVADLRILPLGFESRRRAQDAFAALGIAGSGVDGDLDPGILAGFRIVEQYSESTRLKDHIDFILDHVLVAQLELSPDTDLNRYFEIMNTRGEQLQQQDIVKAKLMAAIATDSGRATFAWVWDACAVMDNYIQVALTPADTTQRGRLFGESWNALTVDSFELLEDLRPERSAGSDETTGTPSLEQAIRRYATTRNGSRPDVRENERFSSVIAFPVFLLHVLRVVEDRAGDDENEIQLDDKRLIDRFASYLKGGDAEARAKNFLIALLRCRVLFDSLVLKREFTAATGDDGVWSLKRVLRGVNRSKGIESWAPRYVGSFPSDRVDSVEGESSDDSDVSKRIRLLEAALRVTFTSPRTMHWITDLLVFAFHSDLSELSAERVLDRLESYALRKLAPEFAEGSLTSSGFDIPRLAYTYLDYLLAVDAGDLDFQFSFRNSVEHFYPQRLDAEHQRGFARLTDQEDLNRFGNLALVSVRDNSKFTNASPYVKAGFTRIVDQSLKLRRMAATAEDSPTAWDSAAIRAHHEQMVRRLWVELRRRGIAAPSLSAPGRGSMDGTGPLETTTESEPTARHRFGSIRGGPDVALKADADGSPTQEGRRAPGGQTPTAVS